ncbi:MAG TPA: SIS domain-containing protein [Acidobacteriota bacterium]|nr:SIS domain-containing protein [Acidobacteriota bacterium]
MNAATTYLQAAEEILKRISQTQMEAIEKAADICANTIANEGLVHLFGTGHSRMFLEEMYPRHGSFPGFHPIVELSLTYHTQVVGANGQRQAMFLERTPGFGRVIMRNFVFSPPDSFVIFSNSGVNEVVVEVGLEAKQRGMPLIVVVSVEHSQASRPRHCSGKRLIDIADLTIDNCTPPGDALVRIDGLLDPVGPGSTIGAAAVANALKVAVAQRLTALGKPPLVLTSSYFVGEEASRERFEASYDDYRRRIRRVYGG